MADCALVVADERSPTGYSVANMVAAVPGRMHGGMAIALGETDDPRVGDPYDPAKGFRQKPTSVAVTEEPLAKFTKV